MSGSSQQASPVDIWAGYVKNQLAAFNEHHTFDHEEIRSTNEGVCAFRVTGATRIPFTVLQAIRARGDVVDLDINGSDQHPIAVTVAIKRARTSPAERAKASFAVSGKCLMMAGSVLALLMALLLAALSLSGELNAVRTWTLLI
jgi:hypothetical protein